MRLSEALIIRADLQKRIQQLSKRLIRSSRIQEDEQPPEDPQELLIELENTLESFVQKVSQINHTNQATQFDNNRTVTDALASRDGIKTHRQILENLISSATGSTDLGYRRSHAQNVKMFSTINVRDIQKQMDTLSRQYRELDTRIQEINWTTELIE